MVAMSPMQVVSHVLWCSCGGRVHSSGFPLNLDFSRKQRTGMLAAAGLDTAV